LDVITLFLVGLLAMALVVIALLHKYYSSKMLRTLDEWKKTELREYENQIYKNIKLEYKADYEEKFRKLEEKYQEKTEEWKQKELENIKNQIHTNVANEYKAKYESMTKENLEKLHKEYEDKFNEWKQKELAELQIQINTSVANEYKAKYESMLKENLEKTHNEYEDKFNEWKQKELAELKGNINKEYETKFEEWKRKTEMCIRTDAIQRSSTTILGKVGEQLAPLLLFENHNINLKDLRFLGSPIDFIAFKGLEEEKPKEVVFIEVKSGNSANLTKRERMVKKLIENKKVSWMTFHTKTELNNSSNKNIKETIERA
jgi:predicted Holliday junction resolvase-like endonuclease